jgi:hypothetical protein
MSTDYRFDKGISKDEFLGSLKKIDVSEHKSEDKSEDESFCITDGTDYMWCYMHNDMVADFCRYGGNYEAEEFLAHVADDLQLELFNEYDNFIEE